MWCASENAAAERDAVRGSEEAEALRKRREAERREQEEERRLESNPRPSHQRDCHPADGGIRPTATQSYDSHYERSP